MTILVLDATTKTIKVNLAQAAATTNPDYVVTYADNGASFTEASSDGALNGTSDVTVVSAPAANTRRVIKSIVIQNRDTASATVTIKYDNNGTQRRLAQTILASGETWTLEGTFTTSGALKQTIGTPLTTKGDLLVHNGSDGTRLAVGSNDYILTADSTQTTGVKWAQNTGASTGKATAIAMIFGF
jgi:hypothetical protein